MMPDYETAARKAIETLIENNVASSPVDPFKMLKRLPGVLTVSYADMSESLGMNRTSLISALGLQNQDAATSVIEEDGTMKYVVAYNQKLPHYLLQRGIARELGHIILGHDGSQPEEVSNEEAKCFTHHLLTPRPLINLIQATGMRLTKEVLNNLTGCNDRCLGCMRRLPAVHVPAELNRKVRDNFMEYFRNFFEFQRSLVNSDGSATADLGTYMEGYEE